MIESKGHYIHGAWVTGQGHAFESINPANQATVWEGRNATADEVQHAFDAAHQAAPSWAKRTLDERISFLQAFAKAIDVKKNALVELISKENGKPLWEAATEVSSVMAKVNLSIQAYQERTNEQDLQPSQETRAFVRYKPHGVVAVLGPFNFPAHLSNGHIVPALLAGNTVIYKPSELTPAVAEFVVQCWHDAELPSGVLNLVQGDGESAQNLLQTPLCGVYFTGSYQTGLKINQMMAHHPEVIVALEMGGNNPLVIDEVEDLNAAVYHAMISSMISSGQRCTCARRIMIPNSSYGDKFLNQFIAHCQQLKPGRYSDQPEPFMGPVISNQHARQHLTAQEQLIQSGGETLLKMTLQEKGTGLISPGIIDMTHCAAPLDEEIFAPLVQIFRYKDFSEAISLSNNTKYGLSAALFSDQRQQFERFYEEINAGIINWNRPTTGALSTLPFGGIGHSGNHRPSAYFAADYCAYPIASIEHPKLTLPGKLLPGVEWRLNL